MTEREPLLTAKEVKAEIASRSHLYDEPTRAAFFLGATWGAQVVRSKMEARAQPAQADADGLVFRETTRGKDYIRFEATYTGKPAQAGQVLTVDDLWTSDTIMALNAELGLSIDQIAKFARAIEAAVLAKRVPQWLPIETAPKDGTEILLSNCETVAQGNWLHAEPYIRERRDADGRYVDQDEFDGYDGWIDQTGGMQPDPTHWMPLPPPPGIVGEKGGA